MSLPTTTKMRVLWSGNGPYHGKTVNVLVIATLLARGAGFRLHATGILDGPKKKPPSGLYWLG